MTRTQLLCFVMALLALPSLAMADSFSPTTVDRTIGVGESFSVTKTISVDGRTADTPVDIMFMFDTTNSFAPYFTSSHWDTVAANLVTYATGLYTDVRFAVAHYEDYPQVPWGAPGDTEYELLQSFTSNATTATGALQGITTGTGNDDRESDLVALGAAAGESWRAGAVKILVWVGDQPGHLPGDTGFDGLNPVVYPGTVDVDGAVAALLAQGVMVEAFSIPPGLGSQAADIAGPTGGDPWSIATDPSDPTVGLDSIYDTFADALDEAFKYYDVSLDLSQLPAGLALSVISPATTSGDRTAGSESYQWVLTFTGQSAGTYSFGIDGRIDGFVLGTESDRILVGQGGTPPPGGEVPEPTSIALLGLGLLGVGVVARRRKK